MSLSHGVPVSPPPPAVETAEERPANRRRALLRDSRGRESVTLSLVVVSWLVATCRFALSGIVPAIASVSPAEYGAACGVILAIWLGREWTEKRG